MSAIQPPLFIGVNGEITAADLGLPYRDLVSEGVLAAGDFAVSQRAAGANMSVDVAKGAAWVKGDDNADTQPTYRVRNDATVNVAIAAADGTNPRIDRIVARVFDSAFAGTQLTWDIEVVKGTPASGANLSNLSGATAIPHNAILLANVLVPAGASSIVTADISDQRNLATSALPQAASLSFGPRPGTSTDSMFGRLAAGVLGDTATSLSTGPTAASPGGGGATGVILSPQGFIVSVASAAGTTSLALSLTGDTQHRLTIDHAGTISWGPGGTTAPDTTLSRAAAGLLQQGASPSASDNSTKLATTAFVKAQGYVVAANPQVFLGTLSTGPTTLGPGGGGVAGFAADDTHVVTVSTSTGTSALQASLTTDSQARLNIDHAGAISWGPGGSTAPDMQLFRNGTREMRLAATGALDSFLSIGNGVQRGWIIDAGGGLAICQTATQKLGFYGATPIVRPTAAANTTLGAAGTFAAHIDDTYTGGVGATAYTVGDIVRALKQLGLITS